MLVAVPWPAADWIELNGRLTLLVTGGSPLVNCSAERPTLTALAAPSLPTMLISPLEVMVTPGGRPETESTGIGLFGSLPGGDWMPREPCRKFARSLSVVVSVIVNFCVVSVLPPTVPVKLKVPVVGRTLEYVPDELLYCT